MHQPFCLLMCLVVGVLAKSRTQSFSKNHVLASKGVNGIVHASNNTLPAARATSVDDSDDDASKNTLPAARATFVDDSDADQEDDMYRTDATECPMAFGGRCRCGMAEYQRREKYVVNCTNSGFTDASVLSALPDNTEVLIFTGNFVERLLPNVFGTDFNFDDLETVDMSNNGIKEIDGQAFHRVSSVTTLILNHNSLYIVEKKHHPRVFSNFVNLESLHLTNAFTEEVDSKWYMVSLEIIFQTSMLTKLKKLHLEQNEIWNLRDPRTFCHLPSLQQLYLGSNRLTDVDLDLFCLPHLAHLDLEYNSIRRLDSNDTALFDALAARNDHFSVKLTGNPFFCDCEIRPLYHWLMTTDTRVLEHEVYRCFTGRPASNAGRHLMQLDTMECAPPPPPPPPARASAASVILGMLVLGACVVLAGVIFVQRHRLARGAKSLQPQLQTAIQSVKRARQYTNIEREEDAPEVAV